jgi:molybdopterin-containing oxidoreductase family membrane subunit
MTGFSKAWDAVDIKSAYNRILSAGPVYFAFVSLFGLLFIIGVAAGIHALFVVGSRHAYGTYREIPLAIQISTYAFFIGASTGLYLISSIGHVFGVGEFMPISRRTIFLSIVTILSGYMVIGLEIENPIRMLIYNITSPNLASNIWWMGTLYGGYLLFMVVSFIFLLTGKYKIAAIAGFLAALSVVAADSNMGAVFAMMHGRQFWYGPFLPIYFIASAIMTGCAFLIFFTLLAYQIKQEVLDAPTSRSLKIVCKLTLLMLGIVLFFTFWKILTGAVGSPAKLIAMSALLSGPYAFNFWGLEVIGGMIIPFFLLLLSRGKKLKPMFIASAMMIFCIFFMRLDLVVVGQIVPLYMELGVVEHTRLHTYAPSLHEILVVLGGAGFCGFAFLLGEKIFNGFRGPAGNPAWKEMAIPDQNVEKV